MAALQGWRRVDQSKEPTVPRGISEGLFEKDELLTEERRVAASEQPHSMEAAGQWAAGQWGHLAPSDVTKPTHIEAVLQNPHSAVVDGGRATEENVAQVFSQSGILPVPSALAELPNRLERRQHLSAALQQQQHGTLSSQLQRSMLSWQTGVDSSFPTPIQNLGVAAGLPTSIGGGSTAVGDVSVSIHGSDVPEVGGGGGGGGGAGGDGGSGGSGSALSVADAKKKRRRLQKSAHETKKREDPKYNRKKARKQKFRRLKEKRKREGLDPPEEPSSFSPEEEDDQEEIGSSDGGDGGGGEN